MTGEAAKGREDRGVAMSRSAHAANSGRVPIASGGAGAALAVVVRVVGAVFARARSCAMAGVRRGRTSSGRRGSGSNDDDAAATPASAGDGVGAGAALRGGRIEVRGRGGHDTEAARGEVVVRAELVGHAGATAVCSGPY